MSSLSDDVVTDIILKLPVKSVARSMCVCKTWRATISDDYVRRRLPPHMSLVYFPDATVSAGNKSPRFVSCAADGRQLEDCDLGFFPFLDRAVLRDASNGLLLFHCAATARFYVVEPVARRWAALPPPPTPNAVQSMLAFDPSSPARYRVVSFTGWRGRVGEVEVFLSETAQWTVRDADFGVLAGCLSDSMHLHGGAVYALAFDPDCIVRMDDLARCTTIPLPQPSDGAGPVAHCRGLLHYVTSDRDRFNVWAMDEAASPPATARQWELRCAVKVEDVVEGGGRGAGEVRFLALHPEKDAAYLWSPWRVVEYDLTRKEITGAWEFGDDKQDHKNRVFKTWLVPSSFYLSDCCLFDR